MDMKPLMQDVYLNEIKNGKNTKIIISRDEIFDPFISFYDKVFRKIDMNISIWFQFSFEFLFIHKYFDTFYNISNKCK